MLTGVTRSRGRISAQAVEFIESIFASVGTNGLPDQTFLDLANHVASIASEGELEEREVITDLYVECDGIPDLFVEIKSPKPNKGQCLEAIRRQLTVHAITGCGTDKVRAFFASAYNPYGLDKSLY